MSCLLAGQIVQTNMSLSSKAIRQGADSVTSFIFSSYLQSISLFAPKVAQYAVTRTSLS